MENGPFPSCLQPKTQWETLFWISQGGEGFIQQKFIVVGDDLRFMISHEQHPLKSGFVNLEWTEISDVQT